MQQRFLCAGIHSLWTKGGTLIKKLKLALVAAAISVAAPGTNLFAGGLFNFNKCDALCCDDNYCQDGSASSLYCDGCDSCGLTSCLSGSCLSGSLFSGSLLSGGCLSGSCLSTLDPRNYIRRSERCFDDFISPMINPIYFEDPRNLSELRPIFISHRVPTAAGGGSIQLYAAQFRAALTENLSLIAVKDGYVVSGNPLIDDGWASVALGLKYNVLRDAYNGRLASVGFTYDIPMGSAGTFQSLGGGQFYLFGTAGQRFLDGDAHYLTSFGYRFPTDSSVQSSSFNWSHQVDLRLTRTVYALTGLSWWHWNSSASGGIPLGVAGQDLFNLPANNVTGNNLLTQNVGMKYKPSANTEMGIAYEFPLTRYRDVIKDRVQLDLIFRY